MHQRVKSNRMSTTLNRIDEFRQRHQMWTIFRRRSSVLYRVVSVVLIYVIAICYYHATENWTIVDSIYFVTVTVSTIGYGDFHPDNDAVRIFTAFFIIAGLVFVLTAVDDLARYVVIRKQSNLIARMYPRSNPMVCM